ncbi:hypothetical protein SAMN05216224_11251 [Thioclava dalianensis]|nr:hypothetical protein SAMN05216224_11251 [Thioclava dalianensis]
MDILTLDTASTAMMRLYAASAELHSCRYANSHSRRIARSREEADPPW